AAAGAMAATVKTSAKSEPRSIDHLRTAGALARRERGANLIPAASCAPGETGRKRAHGNLRIGAAAAKRRRLMGLIPGARPHAPPHVRQDDRARVEAACDVGDGRRVVHRKLVLPD